jgi:hypothetical protein
MAGCLAELGVMTHLAITLLWMAIYIIVLVAVVWVILWAIRSIIEIPVVIERAVWVIVVLLVCIMLISALSGVGPFFVTR